MAATGMVLRSTKPLGLMKKEEAESASRRHLDNPMSLGIRMEANGPPAPPLLTSGPRLPLPENEALSFFKTSRTSCSPVVSIWAAVTVSTGAGPTVSAVGVYEGAGDDGGFQACRRVRILLAVYSPNGEGQTQQPKA